MPILRLASLDPNLLPDLNRLLDRDWDLAQGERFLANPDNALFLAFEDSAPVGLLIAYRLKRFDALQAGVPLYGIGVEPPYKRQASAGR